MKYTVIVNCVSHCISTALLNYLIHDHEDSVKHATTGPAPRPTPYKPPTSPEIFVNSIS